MKVVTCPYCGELNQTSAPELMGKCACCDQPFAESRTRYQRLVILSRDVDGVWDVAERLAAAWQEEGDLESEVIVDRRYQGEAHLGGERRRYSSVASGAGQ
ncbi:MAG: hypothetical protein ACYC5A_01735 [Thermoleophilia bacterium]